MFHSITHLRAVARSLTESRVFAKTQTRNFALPLSSFMRSAGEKGVSGGQKMLRGEGAGKES